MTESKSSPKQNLSGLMVLLLFGVFAVCILSVLLSGTGVYNRLTQRDAEAFDSRSAVQYLATRVHQAEGANSVSLKPAKDGGDMLVITQDYDLVEYETVLYCEEGWLCELFVEADSDLEFEAGERILPASRLEGHIENSLLTLTVTDTSGEHTVRLLLRGGETQP